MNAEAAGQWKDFYRDVAVLAFPTPDANQRIADADEKALYYREPYSSKPGVKPFLPAPGEYPALAADQCIAADQVIDLTSQLSADGQLNWEAPPGRWTIMRFGRTITGQTTRPAPTPGLGLESDKFDPAALDAQFAAFAGKLIARLGPIAHSGSGLTMLHFDSWEMGSQNWSEHFGAEFRRRRGYDSLKYLPALSGFVVGTVEITERFLWDLRQTASELIVENHARHLRELAHRNGLRLSIEPYDLNPSADLALGAEADVPMCEFWADGDGFETSYSCFEAASIAHTHGKATVAAEAFTGAGKSAWTRHPGTMKNQADWAFALGINRLTFHRYQHQPWTNRVPGLTMGGYGTQYERTQTWWEMSRAWHDYLSRCQYLLRQGLPVADILYLTPEGAPQVFRPPPSALAGSKNMPDRKGYDFDGIDPRSLVERVQVRAGKLVLPDGMSYRVLVLPDRQTMTPSLLRKLKELVGAGATVLGPPPRKSPSLTGYPGCDAEVKTLAAELWGDCDGTKIKEHGVGQGQVRWDDSTSGVSASDLANRPNQPAAEPSEYGDFSIVSGILRDAGVPPDFECEGPVRHLHRRAGEAEIYFVANREARHVDTTCIFRLKGRMPELWDPESGARRGLPDFTPTPDGRTIVPLSFEPTQSYFVVFRSPAVARDTPSRAKNFPEFNTVAEVTGPWTVSFPPDWGAPETITLDKLISWSDHSEAGVKHFSGIATYRRTLAVAAAPLAPGESLWLDLGEVQVMAEVSLNGRKLGTVWKAPFRVNLADAVKPGDNALEIRVVNLWPNRMIGDAQLPEDTKRGKNGFALAWPQWLLKGLPSPTGRFTFASFDPWKPDSPLLPSGLLGPVTLLRTRL